MVIIEHTSEKTSPLTFCCIC